MYHSTETYRRAKSMKKRLGLNYIYFPYELTEAYKEYYKINVLLMFSHLLHTIYYSPTILLKPHIVVDKNIQLLK